MAYVLLLNAARIKPTMLGGGRVRSGLLVEMSIARKIQAVGQMAHVNRASVTPTSMRGSFLTLPFQPMPYAME